MRKVTICLRKKLCCLFVFQILPFFKFLMPFGNFCFLPLDHHRPYPVIKGWVAKVRAHMHTCDVRTFLGLAMCDHTLPHFLQQNGQNLPFAILQLFTHILKHTRSSKTVKDVLKPSFSHLCVRTNIWTCKVRVCDPKNGLNPPFGFHGQKNIFFTL